MTIDETRPAYHFKPLNVGRWIVWGLFALLLIVTLLQRRRN